MPCRHAAVSLAVAGLAATAVVAPSAQASDAGLKKTVVRYEHRLTPVAEAFAKADQGLATASDTNAASAATGRVRTSLRAYKTAIVPIKTRSATSAAAKKQLLTAIREYDLGLVQYQKLLDQVNAGTDKTTLKATFTTLNKRIKAAADDEAGGRKKLGLP